VFRSKFVLDHRLDCRPEPAAPHFLLALEAEEICGIIGVHD
jgi:hypothetical protein